MMRSLYAGVSGLQNHQTRMDVVGNNIANVNTTGFKRGRVNFQDMISQSMSGAAKPTDEIGGVNPKQVGLGMMVATIDTIHTQGAFQTTGVNTDLAISGEGFFILKDGDQSFYTRAGVFGLDKNGVLVNPANGLKVQGWQSQNIGGEEIIRTASDPGDLLIPMGQKDPARATTSVDLACNLDKRTDPIPDGLSPQEAAKRTWTMDKTIYDSFGNTHRMTVTLTRDGANPDIPNQWIANVALESPEGFDNGLALGLGDTRQGNTFTVNFSNLGALQSITDATGAQVTEGQVLIPVTFNVPGANPGDNATQTFNLNLGEVGSYTNTVTQFADNFSTKAFRQDGYGMGYLEGFRIDQSGVITGSFSNGTNRSLGQIALASFTNPGGLEKAGESTFVVTNNSGDANVGTSGIAGKGTFNAGALEMSNVDLADAFTDMIVTQRGFQANSKTINTADQMLQELINLKR